MKDVEENHVRDAIMLVVRKIVVEEKELETCLYLQANLASGQPACRMVNRQRQRAASPSSWNQLVVMWPATIKRGRQVV